MQQYATRLNSMVNTICRFKGRPWERKWHHHSPTFSWVVWETVAAVVSLNLISRHRFVGDIDKKWIHGRETLETILKGASNFHRTIKFTVDVCNDKHVFLDTMSHLEGDRVIVNLYTKPADSHQYLLPSSPAAVRTTLSVLRYASDIFAQTTRLLRWDWKTSLISSATMLSEAQHRPSHSEGYANGQT